jgi:hypothetical protein
LVVLAVGVASTFVGSLPAHAWPGNCQVFVGGFYARALCTSGTGKYMVGVECDGLFTSPYWRYSAWKESGPGFWAYAYCDQDWDWTTGRYALGKTAS